MTERPVVRLQRPEVSEDRADNLHLIKFLDGPFQYCGNTPTAQPGVHGMVIGDDVFGWPLPEILSVKRVDGEMHMTADVIREPGVAIYRKISESQLTDEQARRTTHVVRGAVYSIEEWNA